MSALVPLGFAARSCGVCSGAISCLYLRPLLVSAILVDFFSHDEAYDWLLISGRSCTHDWPFRQFKNDRSHEKLQLACTHSQQSPDQGRVAAAFLKPSRSGTSGATHACQRFQPLQPSSYVAQNLRAVALPVLVPVAGPMMHHSRINPHFSCKCVGGRGCCGSKRSWIRHDVVADIAPMVATRVAALGLRSCTTVFHGLLDICLAGAWWMKQTELCWSHSVLTWP